MGRSAGRSGVWKDGAAVGRAADADTNEDEDGPTCAFSISCIAVLALVVASSRAKSSSHCLIFCAARARAAADGADHELFAQFNFAAELNPIDAADEKPPVNGIDAADAAASSTLSPGPLSETLLACISPDTEVKPTNWGAWLAESSPVTLGSMPVRAVLNANASGGNTDASESNQES